MSKRDDLFDGHDRRTFLTTAGAATMTAALTGCDGAPGDRYTLAAESSRTPLPIDPDFASLVRYASLAPSGHNTQPWLFSHSERHVRIAADPKRRTPVGDPDDHHLYVSLGCATENFAIAAGARGQSCEITSRDGRVDIALGTTAVRADALFDAIPHRQMTRSAYDRRPVAPATIRQLEAAAATDGVAVHILTATRDRDAIRDLVVAGNDAQMDDPAFIAELKNWIRFDAPSAIEHRDGLQARCGGNPAIPPWIGERFFGQIFTKTAEDAKYAAHIGSSSGIAVFVGARADADSWIAVGRSFERFALQATARDIRVAMVNQAVEVPSVTRELAKMLGLGSARPDLVVRFGHAPTMPMTLRRPPRAIITHFTA